MNKNYLLFGVGFAVIISVYTLYKINSLSSENTKNLNIINRTIKSLQSKINEISDVNILNSAKNFNNNTLTSLSEDNSIDTASFDTDYEKSKEKFNSDVIDSKLKEEINNLETSYENELLDNNLNPINKNEEETIIDEFNKEQELETPNNNFEGVQEQIVNSDESEMLNNITNEEIIDKEEIIDEGKNTNIEQNTNIQEFVNQEQEQV